MGRHSGYNTKYHIRFRRLLISSKLMTTYIPSHSSLTLPVSAFEPSQPHRINSSTQSRSDLHQLCRPSSTTAVRTSFVSVRTLEHWSLLPDTWKIRRRLCTVIEHLQSPYITSNFTHHARAIKLAQGECLPPAICKTRHHNMCSTTSGFQRATEAGTKTAISG